MASRRLHLTLPLAMPERTCSPLPSSALTISVLLPFQGNCQGSRGQRYLSPLQLRWETWSSVKETTVSKAAVWHSSEWSSSQVSWLPHQHSSPGGLCILTPDLSFGHLFNKYWALAGAACTVLATGRTLPSTVRALSSRSTRENTDRQIDGTWEPCAVFFGGIRVARGQTGGT